MVFYSHAQTEKSGQRYGSKLLKVHTKGVLEKAHQQLHRNLRFNTKSSVLEKILTEICRFHDLGKYTGYFQAYLLGKPTCLQIKQHARFGAIIAYNLCQARQLEWKWAYVVYFIILNHHRNLSHPLSENSDRLLSKIDWEEVTEIFEVQAESILSNLNVVSKELGESGIADYFLVPDIRPMRKSLKIWLIGEKATVSVEDYFTINYLFSLLIEADKLDASDTSIHILQSLNDNAVAEFISAFPQNSNPQNELRNHVRRQVLKKLSDPDILEKKIFLLTAPTGIGKTLTALDFAVQLRNTIEKETHYIPQIITALPFINIIEQTLAVYQKVFPQKDIRILAHYQYADVFGKQAEGDLNLYAQKLMQVDTWQADIVITSFVQLLQTLISNKNKLLKKFNHLAGSIIIMDEVQSLRLEQVPLIGAMLFFLSRYLDTRLILMTATQPLIFELADDHILKKLNLKSSSQVTQLIDKPKEIFQAFRRTQLVPLIENTITNEEDFLEIFESKWQNDLSCLIVVNTVSRSLAIYDTLINYFLEREYENPIYYLSTNIIPAHRLSRIEAIKQDLAVGKSPILITTQVVEAGVDLDFDMGFRDLGPIDSIVQVAGRINRENNVKKEYAPLYVVDLGDCQKIYGPITRTQAKQALQRNSILEPEYYDLVAMYFKNLTEDSAYEYSEKMFDAISQLKYDGEENYTIDKYKVIKEGNTTGSVFIDWDESSSAALSAFRDIFQYSGTDKRRAKQIFDRYHKRTFHQHIITLPHYYLPTELERIVKEDPDIDIFWVPKTELDRYYKEENGFIRQIKDYKEDTSTLIL